MSYLVMGMYDGGIAMEIGKYLDEIGHSVIGTDKSLDVRSYHMVDQAIHNLVYEEIDSESRLMGLVYCAGINDLQWLGQMGESEMEKAADIFAVNTLGFLNVVNSVRKAITNHPSDLAPFSIVAVSSDAATRPLRTSAAYCASKAALDAIVRVSARELGPSNFRVNAVSPGMVDGTGMTEQMDEMIPRIRGWSPEEAIKYEKTQEVVPGRVTTEEVAELVSSVLLGPRHLNGAIVPINGGR